MAWWALKSKAARLGLVESLSAHPGRLSLVNASRSEPELKTGDHVGAGASAGGATASKVASVIGISSCDRALGLNASYESVSRF